MVVKLRSAATVCALTGLLAALCGTAQANWVETFDNNKFDLPTWKFPIYPDIAKTFKAEIKDDPNGSDYLALTETTSVGVGGSAFGAGFGSEEVFTDVRIGAIVNVLGDASRNYCGLAGRTTYFIDDGSVSGLPGFFTTQTYVMHVNWQDGPANLRIDIEKVVNMGNIMRNEVALGLELAVPGLAHARSYYAELDILGSDPVYVTGSIYERKGGPLVAKTATMVDTKGNDPWEDEGVSDAPFAKGVSGIFGQNEDEEPAGYYVTFDDVFSVSDGPAAVNPSPVDGATGVPVDVTLSWIEAAFATGRELWLGKPGAMQKVASPAGKTYTPGSLEFGQKYQWRVDQVGPSGTVTGRTWAFTTAECLSAEDFQSYGSDADIQGAWPHNIPGGFQYVFLGTDNAGNKSMRFEFQNQYEPYFTEATRTFGSPQDWTQMSVQALSLAFAGENDNVEHPMYLKLEDAAGRSGKVQHPYTYACQSESWRDWTVALADFSTGGVDLAHVKKLTIGLGSGTNSGQADKDRDTVYIDNVRLCPAQCYNVDQLDLRGDVNGDCRIDLKDLAIMGDGWLNNGVSAAP